MNLKNITAAKIEAQRFLQRIKEVEAEVKDYKKDYSSDATLWGTKATGALRRASMDLTRALAEMRR